MEESEKIIEAIIIDDEQGARDVLQKLLHLYCPNVKVLADHSNLPDSIESIKNLKPDVVFLDIEMPNYAGYEIISFFDQIDFEIIFVTAYDQYAVKAFELSAVDYLLKPIDIDRLQSSVAKLKSKLEASQMIDNYQILVDSLQSKEVAKMVIPYHGGQKSILLKQIVAIEAQESYSCIYLSDQSHYIVSKNLKHYESVLCERSDFFRSHKSWIVNIKHIDNYSKSKLEIQMNANILARLSKYKKVEFEKFMLH